MSTSSERIYGLKSVVYIQSLVKSISASTIDKERREYLEDMFSSETNDEDTQEWRDDLTPEESALIDEWDKAYFNGVCKLIEGIATATERNSRS